MAKKKSFRSAPRIVSGRDRDRCTLLIRLASAMCFSMLEASVSVAGKEPSQEVHCRDGHSDAEKHAGKHTLRAPLTEGEGEPGDDNRNQRQPPCNLARKRLLQDAYSVFPRGLATDLRKCPCGKNQRRTECGERRPKPAGYEVHSGNVHH